MSNVAHANIHNVGTMEESDSEQSTKPSGPSDERKKETYESIPYSTENVATELQPPRK